MKRIINKYICGTIIAVSALSFTGCNDFLDRSPQGSFTEDDSSDGGLEEGKVFSIYAQMRSYNITAGIPAFAIHNFRSEDSEKGSLASDGPDMASFFDDFNYTTTNGSVSAYWTHNYTIITNCNTVISILEEKTTPGELDLINLAEAKFFRAYCFFNLVRAFGDVPKIDFKVVDASQSNIPKSPASEIYQLIDQDLAVAEKYLPISWESKYIGRLTWGAARSLHARTYMMRNDWGNMYAAAKEVIDSKVYNLNTPYDKVFTDDGENCGESVFELQCTVTAGRPADLAIGSQFCEVQGIRGSGDWNLGWGWHMATKEMGLAFEAGDPRKDATLIYFRKPGEPITDATKNTPYGESPESLASGAYFNKKAYTNPAKRKLYTNAGFWVNIRLIRYTDVLLMAAEAANEMGNTADALNYLEQVRAHARGKDNTILPKVTTTDQLELRKAIQHERRVELGLEFDRFYDLVRWGIAKEVLHAAGKTNYQDKHRFLPIPQEEIDKSNGVLIQNPDYN